MTNTRFREETLDPEDWEQLTSLGHKMLDDMMEILKTIREKSYSPPTEKAIKKILSPLTKNGLGEDSTYNVFKDCIIPHAPKIIRPDWWGFVNGTGSPFGMLTDMVISGLNDIDNPSFITIHVIRQSLYWIKEMLEYPKEAGGVFVSGGSEANFTCLAVARNEKAEGDMKVKGLQDFNRKMTLYCSQEAHDCLDRSVELLGLGNEALRRIPTNENHQLDLIVLEEEIHRDREKGYHPFCVIGSAGTVHTGAFDDLVAIADLCEREDLWLHVDGAFGSWVKLSDTHRHLADGLEKADSLAVDLHKWMNMPYAIACAFVKDREAHYSTFVYGHDAEYLKSGFAVSDDQLGNPFNLSLALSRPSYGYKAYMLLSAFGRDKYSKLVQQNIDQIDYLAELIRAESNLEITAPVVSNVVCFRYDHDGLDETNLEKVNRSILSELWKIKWGMISDTTLNGRYMLRACNVNHRSRYSDFDVLVERITTIGDILVKAYL
jgi:glutamate/tyrosine decarboxylase-like PLP-dependent enzyme